MTKEKRHFLIITHAFPPMGGGGVQRIVKFAKYLQIYNWDVTVVCPTTDTYVWVDEKRLEEISGIDIIRIPINSLGVDFFAKIRRKLRFIDPFYDWSKDIINKLEQFDVLKFDLVFSSGPPHSVHYVGRALKRKFALKWVADFRDHFTLGPEYQPLSFIHKRFNRLFEQSIYRESDAIVTNTSTNRYDILKKFDLSIKNKNKIFTIYNGYDEDDLNGASTTHIGWDKNKINLIYLGGLRGDHIDGIFYQTVRNALNIKPELRHLIRIHIIGDISRKGSLISDLEIDDVFSFQSFVAFNEVGVYLDHADAGLTWQRDRPEYKGTVAGKIFDYIGKALPVFSLGQEDGEISNILRSNKIGLSVSPENLDEAGRSFITFCEKLENGDYLYSKKTIDLLDEKFNRKKQAEQLNEIFNQLFSI